MKLLVASVAAMLGCGSTSPRAFSSSGAARAAIVPTGAKLWIKPAVEPDGPISRDPMQRDRLMVLDLTTRTSIDIGESERFRLGGLAASLDAAYLTSDNFVSLVTRSGGRWRLAELGPMGPTGDAIDAVASDGNAGVMFEPNGLCVVHTRTSACATTIPLPFEWGVDAIVSYTRGGCVVVSVPTGRQEAYAVGMGQTLQIAVVDPQTRSAARLGVDAIGYFATASVDGRLLWTEHAIEHATDKLLAAVAPLDQLAAKRTFELGPAVAQSDADCSFAGTDRIVCLVLPDHALISASTHDGSRVTLEPEAVMPSFFVSPDARWVAYARIERGDLVRDVDPRGHRALAPPARERRRARVVALTTASSVRSVQVEQDVDQEQLPARMTAVLAGSGPFERGITSRNVSVRSTILPRGSEFGDRAGPAWHIEGSGPSTRRAAS